MCVGVAQKDINTPHPKEEELPKSKPPQSEFEFPEAKLQAILPNSYHINLWKRAAIIRQDAPDRPNLATFGWMDKNWQGRPWPCYNVRCEGGNINKSNDPNYLGPYKIADNPYVKDQIDTQRCIIPVDFFVEQNHIPKGSREKKRKFIIKNEDEQPLFLAGIYKDIVNENTGEIIDQAFTIITTAQTKATALALHQRSPVIIPYQYIGDYFSLPTKELETFYPPSDSDGQIVYEVDLTISKRTLPDGYTDIDERLIKPIGELMRA